MSVFVEGLQKIVVDSVWLYRSRDPFEPLSHFARYVDTVVKIADSRSTAPNSTNCPTRGPTANLNHYRRVYKLFDLFNEGKRLNRSVSDSSKSIQTNSTPSSDGAIYCRVYVREGQTFGKCSVVSEQAKHSLERKKNREAFRTKSDRQGGLSRDREGLQ